MSVWEQWLFFCFLWFFVIFFTFAVTSFHFLVFVSWVLFMGVLYSSHCAHTHTHCLHRDFLYIESTESRGFPLDKGMVVQNAIRDKQYAIRTLMVHELIRVSWPRIAIRCNTLLSWCRFGNSDVFLPFVIYFLTSCYLFFTFAETSCFFSGFCFSSVVSGGSTLFSLFSGYDTVCSFCIYKAPATYSRYN